jgi:hypothetical protein
VADQFLMIKVVLLCRVFVAKSREYVVSIAQLVELRTFNPKVVGSIPTGGTKKEENGYPKRS